MRRPIGHFWEMKKYKGQVRDHFVKHGESESMYWEDTSGWLYRRPACQQGEDLNSVPMRMPRQLFERGDLLLLAKAVFASVPVGKRAEQARLE